MQGNKLAQIVILSVFCIFIAAGSPAGAEDHTGQVRPVTEVDRVVPDLSQPLSALPAQSPGSSPASAGQVKDENPFPADNNPGTAWSIRKNYFLRNPAARQHGPIEFQGQDVVLDQKSLGPGLVAHNLSGPVLKWPVDIPAAVSKVPTFRDQAIQQNLFQTFGFPVSDTQFQIIDRYNDNRFLEQLYDPERTMWMMTALGQIQCQSVANSMNNLWRNQAASAIDYSKNYLINFASDQENKWWQLRNKLFVPMALLLLLPGAVLAQVRAIVAQGSDVLGKVHPFEGIIRSVIAIFMIFSSFLVINYGIDISNVITLTISSKYTELFDSDMYEDAKKAQDRAGQINPPEKNTNKMTGSVKDTGSGTPKTWVEAEKPLSAEAKPDEQRSNLSATERLAVGLANSGLSSTWNVMCAFQVAFLYYLWCMAPIVAALWVWPMAQLRNALSGWTEGVITLCFWSLFWNTSICLLACFREVGENGAMIVTALNFLANVCVKYAFNFSKLVSAAGSQAAGHMESAMSSAQSASPSGASSGGGPGSGDQSDKSSGASGSGSESSSSSKSIAPAHSADFPSDVSSGGNHADHGGANGSHQGSSLPPLSDHSHASTGGESPASFPESIHNTGGGGIEHPANAMTGHGTPPPPLTSGSSTAPGSASGDFKDSLPPVNPSTDPSLPPASASSHTPGLQAAPGTQIGFGPVHGSFASREHARPDLAQLQRLNESAAACASQINNPSQLEQFLTGAERLSHLSPDQIGCAAAGLHAIAMSGAINANPDLMKGIASLNPHTNKLISGHIGSLLTSTEDPGFNIGCFDTAAESMSQLEEAGTSPEDLVMVGTIYQKAGTSGNKDTISGVSRMFASMSPEQKVTAAHALMPIAHNHPQALNAASHTMVGLARESSEKEQLFREGTGAIKSLGSQGNPEPLHIGLRSMDSWIVSRDPETITTGSQMISSLASSQKIELLKPAVDAMQLAQAHGVDIQPVARSITTIALAPAIEPQYAKQAISTLAFSGRAAAPVAKTLNLLARESAPRTEIPHQAGPRSGPDQALYTEHFKEAVQTLHHVASYHGQRKPVAVKKAAEVIRGAATHTVMAKGTGPDQGNQSVHFFEMTKYLAANSANANAIDRAHKQNSAHYQSSNQWYKSRSARVAGPVNSTVNAAS